MCFLKLLEHGTGGRRERTARSRGTLVPTALRGGAKRVHRRRHSHRRGATTVEFALVAVPMFLIIFAFFEFGRSMMAVQTLEEAARAGCRTGVLKDATADAIEDEVADLLRVAGISTYTVQVEPSNPTTARQWDPITVSVTASIDDMTWLPTPMYLHQVSYTASCTLPKESALEDR